MYFNPLPDDKILNWSKLKQITDDIFKRILNEKKVSFRVENIVRNGEIACYKQFILFSQFFSTAIYLLCGNGLRYMCGLFYVKRGILPHNLIIK